MKKAGILIISLLILNILVINLNLAQDIDLGKLDQETGLPKGVPSDIDEAKEKLESKWDYLGKEWKILLLKNRFVSAIDSFFTRISIIFKVLFGMHYSFSLTLFLVILLWLYFLFKFEEIFKIYSFFSDSVSMIISFALVILMANLQIFRKVIEALGWLVFAKKAWWWNVLIIIVIIVAFILFHKLSSAYAKKIKEQKEEAEKLIEKQDRKILHKTVEGIEEGLK